MMSGVHLLFIVGFSSVLNVYFDLLARVPHQRLLPSRISDFENYWFYSHSENDFGQL